MILLIDDMRNLPADRVCRTYAEGIAALQERRWAELLLDHDLGCYENGVEKTGYDVVCWLERNPEHLPEKITLVTSNPVGRQKMGIVIRKLYGVG